MTLPFSALEYSAWAGFLEFHAQITDRLGTALQESHRLGLGEYEVLLALARREDGCLPMSELRMRAFLTRSQSGLSRLIGRLSDRGLLLRSGCKEGDRRNVSVAITDEGRTLIASASREHAARVSAFFLGQLSERELAQLGKVWSRLIERD
jgi:DNA-binding MarR family transcriptional regulator